MKTRKVKLVMTVKIGLYASTQHVVNMEIDENKKLRLWDVRKALDLPVEKYVRLDHIGSPWIRCTFRDYPRGMNGTETHEWYLAAGRAPTGKDKVTGETLALLLRPISHRILACDPKADDFW